MFSFSLFAPETHSLHSVAKQNDSVKAQEILFQGGDINEVDKYGWTPLHYAAFYNRADMVKFLLENGAVESVNQPTYFLGSDDITGFLSNLSLNGGETPLMLTSNAMIGAMLLKAGANLYAKDAAAWTPLHWALHRMNFSSVNPFVVILLKNETSLDIFNQLNNENLKPIDLLCGWNPVLTEEWMNEMVNANKAGQILDLNRQQENVHDWVIDIESPRPSSPGMV